MHKAELSSFVIFFDLQTYALVYCKNSNYKKSTRALWCVNLAFESCSRVLCKGSILKYVYSTCTETTEMNCAVFRLLEEQVARQSIFVHYSGKCAATVLAH